MADSGSRVHDLINAAQDAIRDLRAYTDFRAQRVRLRLGLVQAVCALAASIDRLADVLNEEEQ